MTLMRASSSLLLGLALVGAVASDVYAQSVTVSTNCAFDLQQNGFGNFVNPALVPNGIWLTSNATKKCTNSAARQTILLTCTSKIPSWTGGTKSKNNVRCVVKGDDCGVVPGGPFITTKSTLSVSSAGLAQLQCNLNRNN